MPVSVSFVGIDIVMARLLIIMTLNNSLSGPFLLEIEKPRTRIGHLRMFSAIKVENKTRVLQGNP